MNTNIMTSRFHNVAAACLIRASKTPFEILLLPVAVGVAFFNPRLGASMALTSSVINGIRRISPELMGPKEMWNCRVAGSERPQMYALGTLASYLWLSKYGLF